VILSINTRKYLICCTAVAAVRTQKCFYVYDH
jgi:hypothetical protein